MSKLPVVLQEPPAECLSSFASALVHLLASIKLAAEQEHERLSAETVDDGEVIPWWEKPGMGEANALTYLSAAEIIRRAALAADWYEMAGFAAATVDAQDRCYEQTQRDNEANERAIANELARQRPAKH